MIDDPIAPIRRRFPNGPRLAAPPSASGPVVPFAARYGVPAQVVEAKHGRPPTHTTVSVPTQTGGDGAAVPPSPDDTVVPAED